MKLMDCAHDSLAGMHRKRDARASSHKTSTQCAGGMTSDPHRGAVELAGEEVAGGVQPRRRVRHRGRLAAARRQRSIPMNRVLVVSGRGCSDKAAQANARQPTPHWCVALAMLHCCLIWEGLWHCIWRIASALCYAASSRCTAELPPCPWVGAGPVLQGGVVQEPAPAGRPRRRRLSRRIICISIVQGQDMPLYDSQQSRDVMCAAFWPS